MTFNLFLTTYWVHITAAALAIWNIYLHFKSNRTERKKNLQVSYLQLTSIINDFQVSCVKLFLIEPEVIELKMGVGEIVAKANKLLEDVKMVKKRELIENQFTLADTLKRLKDEFQLIVDDKTKAQKRQEIKLKLAETELLIKEFKEEESMNEPLIKEAKEIYQIAAEKLATFRSDKSQKVISLSKVINEFVNNINSTPTWQLIASKAVIEIMGDLESACGKLNSMLLNLANSDAKYLDMRLIVGSQEFKKVWDMSQAAIKRMRSEV
jgi:hypothetical protein